MDLSSKELALLDILIQRKMPESSQISITN